MMILTAKVDFKKILLILAAIAAVILAIVLMFGGGEAETTSATTTTPNNDSRVKFLQEFGWDVVTSPKESSQVKIPEEPNEVFSRYNALQKDQGFDLTPYAGKKVMRYVYTVNNFPGATEPVYATVLVYKNKIIGGDVTDTSAKGQIRGFKMPTAQAVPPAPAPTLPTVPPVTGQETPTTLPTTVPVE